MSRKNTGQALLEAMAPQPRNSSPESCLRIPKATSHPSIAMWASRSHPEPLRTTTTTTRIRISRLGSDRMLASLHASRDPTMNRVLSFRPSALVPRLGTLGPFLRTIAYRSISLEVPGILIGPRLGTRMARRRQGIRRGDSHPKRDRGQPAKSPKMATDPFPQHDLRLPRQRRQQLTHHFQTVRWCPIMFPTRLSNGRLPSRLGHVLTRKHLRSHPPTPRRRSR